eukprot:6772427-Lingulodinium_polyedra.AAC.1
MRYAMDREEWAAASKCWLCSFFAPGTVLWDPVGEEWRLYLGHVSHLAAVTWPLVKVQSPSKPGEAVF